jgi:hypothetical protein
MEQYILQACFETDTHPEDCRWEKLQYMLERCRCDVEQRDGTFLDRDSPEPSQRFVASEDATREEAARESCQLPGHSLIWILLKPAEYAVPFDAINVKRCLRFIKKHQPTVFLVRNQEGRSLLDIILRASIASPVNTEGAVANSLTRQQWEELALFILEECPKACLIPDLDGNRALDILLHSHISQELFKAVATASAPLTSSRCMLKACRTSRLYPFQLVAATIEKFWRPVDEDTCKIYELLRQAPNLVQSAISTSGPCDVKTAHSMPLETASLTTNDGDNQKRKALEEALEGNYPCRP